MDRIKLDVLGLSYSQSQAGSYALILSNEERNLRLPIIIGGFEAQAIAIEIENLKPPRPLTHDLFFNFASIYNVVLKEVEIYKLEEGVFYSVLVFFDGKSTARIDARTSDAVALALRFKANIYTTSEIMQKAGITMTDEHTQTKEQQKQPNKPKTLESKSIGELEEMLAKAIEDENYEKASKIRDELNKRK
jgi:bifunctional DNase/RNase